MKRALNVLAGAALAIAGLGAASLVAQSGPQQTVDAAYAKFKDLKEGKNADYIPALAKVDPNLFGIALVTVDGKVTGAIDEPGLLVLVGVTHDDTPAKAARLAGKLWGLRILDGEKSCADLGAPLLVISQFTLYAETNKGRRPTWQAAAPGPAVAARC